MTGKHEYNAESIEILEGLEAVRKKIGMYAGTHSAGLHQCVYELLSNSNDEAMNGFGKEISLTLCKDGGVLLRDYGRGIPYEIHPKYGKSTLSILFLQLHAGGKMQSSEEYKNTGGTHGVGQKIATATAEELIVKVWRGDGKMASQSFAKGKATSEVIIVPSHEANTGTEIYYRPELEIFGKDVHWEVSRLKTMCRDFAYLTKNVGFRFRDESSGKEELFLYPHGLKDMYRDSVPIREAITKNPIYLEQDLSEDNKIEIAFGYTDSSSENIKSFCNGLKLIEGGTHVTGFRMALTKAINDVARENGSLKPKDNNITGAELREGLVAILSLRVKKPLFENQTKTKLSNPEITYQVQTVLGEYLKLWMQDYPKETQAIIDKVLQTRKIREAAKKAREAILGVTKKKGSLKDSLVSKLADCTGKNPEENEIFLVEGDSAGGGLKQARDPKHMAILPLLGKVLNVWKEKNVGKILESEAILNIIKALGCGMQDDFNLKKLRYHKIILATDADIDGGHIRTLLLTALYKLVPTLIEEGFVYILVPPLFKVKTPKHTYFFNTDKELEEGKKQIKEKDYMISRFKGLGELKIVDIENTMMSRENRVLKRVSMEDVSQALKVLHICMGDDAKARKDFLRSGGEIES